MSWHNLAKNTIRALTEIKVIIEEKLALINHWDEISIIKAHKYIT